jgi:hypothetical protein
MAAGLTQRAWSIKQVLTYKVTPQRLAKIKEDLRKEVSQPPGEVDKPKPVRGRASQYYLILLKLKEEKARRQSHAL